MKMPGVIDGEMFAPCGMNCKVCYRHCFSPKPCPGCLKGGVAATAAGRWNCLNI